MNIISLQIQVQCMLSSTYFSRYFILHELSLFNAYIHQLFKKIFRKLQPAICFHFLNDTYGLKSLSANDHLK